MEVLSRFIPCLYRKLNPTGSLSNRSMLWADARSATKPAAMGEASSIRAF
jgi:hypothetical protein